MIHCFNFGRFSGVGSYGNLDGTAGGFTRLGQLQVMLSEDTLVHRLFSISSDLTMETQSPMIGKFFDISPRHSHAFFA